MQTTLLAMAFGGVLVLAAGCGGKVAVDGSPVGTGGSAGGTGVSTGGAGGNGAGGSTSTGAFTCDFACGGPVGVCGCAGPCSDGKERAIGCGGSMETGFDCSCVVDGMSVGTCAAQGLACQLAGSCCEALFAE